MAEVRKTAIAERRYHGRVDGADIPCSAGRLVNISRGGMAVLGGRPWRSVKTVTIGPRGHEVKVRVERVRVRRVGLFRFVVGYRFIAPPPDLFQRVVVSTPLRHGTRVI